MFYGGNPSAFPETEKLVLKWNPFFNIFLQSVDKRTGSFLHLPFEGGLFNQPSKTMTILMIMQGLYCEKLSDEMKKIKNHRKR